MESHAESLKQMHVIASYKRYKPKEAPGILERPQIQAWAQNKHLCFFQCNQSCLYPSNSLAPIAGPSRFESSHNAVLLLSSFLHVKGMAHMQLVRKLTTLFMSIGVIYNEEHILYVRFSSPGEVASRPSQMTVGRCLVQTGQLALQCYLRDSSSQNFL